MAFAAATAAATPAAPSAAAPAAAPPAMPAACRGTGRQRPLPRGWTSGRPGRVPAPEFPVTVSGRSAPAVSSGNCGIDLAMTGHRTASESSVTVTTSATLTAVTRPSAAVATGRVNSTASPLPSKRFTRQCVEKPSTRDTRPAWIGAAALCLSARSHWGLMVPASSVIPAVVNSRAMADRVGPSSSASPPAPPAPRVPPGPPGPGRNRSPPGLAGAVPRRFRGALHRHGPGEAGHPERGRRR